MTWSSCVTAASQSRAVMRTWWIWMETTPPCLTTFSWEKHTSLRSEPPHPKENTPPCQDETQTLRLVQNQWGLTVVVLLEVLDYTVWVNSFHFFGALHFIIWTKYLKQNIFICGLQNKERFWVTRGFVKWVNYPLCVLFLNGWNREDGQTVQRQFTQKPSSSFSSFLTAPSVLARHCVFLAHAHMRLKPWRSFQICRFVSSQVPNKKSGNSLKKPLESKSGSVKKEKSADQGDGKYEYAKHSTLHSAVLDSHLVVLYLLIRLFSFRSADAGGREGEGLGALGGVQSVHPGFRRVARLPLHPGPLCSQCGQHSLQQLVAQLLDQTGQRGKRPWAVRSKGKAERLQSRETRVEVFKYFMSFWPLPVFFFLFFLELLLLVCLHALKITNYRNLYYFWPQNSCT